VVSLHPVVFFFAQHLSLHLGLTDSMARSKVHGRSKGVQVKTCTICGTQGHREETCPSVAGDKIRALKARLRQAAQKGKTKTGPAKSKARQSSQKTGTWKQEAQGSYTKIKQPLLKPSARSRPDRAAVLKERAEAQSAMGAYNALVRKRYYKKPVKCIRCGKKSLSEVADVVLTTPTAVELLQPIVPVEAPAVGDGTLAHLVMRPDATSCGEPELFKRTFRVLFGKIEISLPSQRTMWIT
jgi:hypothetical protein